MIKSIKHTGSAFWNSIRTLIYSSRSVSSLFCLNYLCFSVLKNIKQATQDVDASGNPPIQLLTSFLAQVVPLCKDVNIKNAVWMARISRCIGEHIAHGVCLAEMSRKSEGRSPDVKLEKLKFSHMEHDS